jgi:hypothetical protein
VLNSGGSLTNSGQTQIGNGGVATPSTLNVTGTFTNTGGNLFVYGGNAAGSNALLNVSGAAPGTLTGNYELLSSVGSAAVEWGSGAITQIGDGVSNSGYILEEGSTAYLEVGATDSNSALKGLATIAGADIVTNAAAITLSSSAAKIENQSGTNALTGFTTNTANGKFTLSRNAGLTTTGAFSNAGAVTVSTGSTFTLGGAVTQTGGISTVDGTLAGTGSLNLNAGNLYGTGTLDYGVVDSATVTPGNSASSEGALQVSGTYTQKSTGNLDVTFGGAAAGTQYDQLNVSATASLTGTLKISLATGYTPPLGATYDILNASSLAETSRPSTAWLSTRTNTSP